MLNIFEYIKFVLFKIVKPVLSSFHNYAIGHNITFQKYACYFLNNVQMCGCFGFVFVGYL